MTVESALQLVVEHIQAGRRAEGEQLFRQIHAEFSNEPEVVYRLGLIAQQYNEIKVAIELITQAVALLPNQARFHASLGLLFETAKQMDPAIAHYKRAVDLDPKLAVVHNNLANCLAAKNQIEQAVAHLRLSISIAPAYADPVYNLGSILQSLGQSAEAIKHYQRALELRPNWPDALNNLGICHQNLGDLNSAIISFQMAVEAAPQYTMAINNLLGVMSKSGRHEQAAVIFGRLAESQPNLPEAINAYGIALTGLNRLEDAAAAYRRAISVRENYAEAMINLAYVLRRLDRPDEAISHLEKAQVHCPPSQLAVVFTNLAEALNDKSEFDRAIENCRKALAVVPNHADAHCALGLALMAKGNVDAAAAAHNVTTVYQPNSALYANNYAAALCAQGNLDQALYYAQRAVVLSPEYPAAHVTLGHILLKQGQWDKAWPEYQWQFRAAASPVNGQTPSPLWDGGELAGRRILVHDQDARNVIQFARYLPLIAQRGGRIVLACSKSLHAIVQQFPQVETVVERGSTPPEHDVQCPMLSLPNIFKTALATIPSPPPLAADPSSVERWRSRLPAGAARKVGVAWNGADGKSPVPPSAQALLTGIEGVWFCDLFAGLGAEAQDLSDLAGLIANLDMIVTLDSAVAHLAASLGKPTWLILEKNADWRWLHDRDDSPWYPRMRLFRQTRFGDWDGLINQTVAALNASRDPHDPS